jgi:drug/metabolite transporter (DMT)-like permease
VAPYLRLLGAQVAIGAAAIFARFALTGTGPLAASALRLAIATLPLALLSLAAGPQPRLGRRAETLLALAGLALAVHFGAWLASLRYTSVAVSTLLVCTSPIWTGLYDAVVLRRPLERAFAAALLLAASGLALVVGGRDVPAPIEGHAIAGDALALLGGVAIGAYLLIVRAVRESTPGAPLAIRRIVLRTYAWGALAVGVGAIVGGEHAPPFSNGTAWFGILAMALVSQLIGHTALNAALRDFPPSTVAMSTLLEPVAAALLAAVIFYEAVSPRVAAGGVLILAAIGLAAVAPNVRSQTTSPPSGP